MSNFTGSHIAQTFLCSVIRVCCHQNVLRVLFPLLEISGLRWLHCHQAPWRSALLSLQPTLYPLAPLIVWSIPPTWDSATSANFWHRCQSIPRYTWTASSKHTRNIVSKPASSDGTSQPWGVNTYQFLWSCLTHGAEDNEREMHDDETEGFELADPDIND